jgi:hypothetical protein
LKYSVRCTNDEEEKLRPTKVLLQMGLDDQTSAKYTISSGLGGTLLILLLVVIFSKSFSIGTCSGRTSNEYPICSNTRSLGAVWQHQSSSITDHSQPLIMFKHIIL